MRALPLVLALIVGLLAPSGGSGAAATERTWKDESIYMVMTDRFRNGDPRNDLDARPGDPRWWQGGDLQGVIDELGYIKGLGMTAIWITPVTKQIAGGYHGYWTLDFYEIDPHLGDMAKLQELVTRAHALGLKVVLDVVLNHVGYGHPWLLERPDWFHPRCDVVDSEQTSVERCWLAGLPDLDTENAAVRAYLEDWTLWLIDRTKVDGIRLDTARHLPKEFLAEWSAKVHAAHPAFWILGEVWSDDYRYQNAYLDAGLDAVTDFYGYHNVARAFGASPDLSWLRLAAPVAESYLVHDPTARGTFIDNHDVPRFVGARPDATAGERLREALVYLFTQPGTPILYYGTEIGLAGGNDPDDRRPMPWTADVDTVTRDLVTRVARLRNDNPVLRRGSYEKLSADRAAYVYLRRLGDSVAVVAINAGDSALDDTYAADDVRIPSGDQVTPGLGASAGAATLGSAGLRLVVPPRSAQVWIFAAAGPAGGAFPAVPIVLVGLALLAALALVVRARNLSAAGASRVRDR